MKNINLKFKTSSYSMDKYCVGVAKKDDKVYVTNTSKNNSEIIEFTKDEWKAFIEGVKDNEFNFFD